MTIALDIEEIFCNRLKDRYSESWCVSVSDNSGVCPGCHIQVHTNLFSKLISQIEPYIICPHCSRIIVLNN